MTRSKLVDQLQKHEGLRLKPYVDTVGKVTIGVGHNLTDKGISYAQAMSILSDDIDETLNFLERRCPWYATLDEVRQRAIADLTFDLMLKLLDFTHMIAAIEQKDFEQAADCLLASKFASQTGNRAVQLAQMLRTGEDPT